MARYNLTTAIPYVNGRPHIGHALELVQADVLARHRRRLGDEVRFQSGTDDNALKNVRAAEAEGITTAAYVERAATGFHQLKDVLDLSFDDFIRTSSDKRHRPGVEELWRRCQHDLYRKAYQGLYCVGCERFYEPADLTPQGTCEEHGTKPEVVEEENWFFRLSSYSDQLYDLIESGRLRIEPASRKREVLAFIQSGLDDFSASRSTTRARGWGIPVPGDPDQVIYVWYDALANYITAPGFGTDPDRYEHWWNASERVHVIGKGIIRFHAVYWPAILLSAGLTLPDVIYVHEYLTANGEKISKTAGNAVDPADLVARYGPDAVRWWLLSDVARAGDTDFTVERLIARANEDLANNLGNLVHRTVSLLHRYRGGAVPPGQTNEAVRLRQARAAAGTAVATALDEFDFRRAVEAITTIGREGNRFVEAVRPWDLAKSGADAQLDAVLAELVDACRDIGEHLVPFLPAAAARIAAQCTGEVEPRPVFPRLEASPRPTRPVRLRVRAEFRHSGRPGHPAQRC